MAEIIERGHIYIAQPPLYKVKKGKQEQYVKDDDALQDYLIQLALDGASLHVNEQAPGINGATLEKLLQDYHKVFKTIKRLSYRYPASFLEACIYLPAVSEQELTNEVLMQGWVNKLLAQLEKQMSNNHRYRCKLFTNTEKQEQQLALYEHVHGIETRFDIDGTFFDTQDYKQLLKLGEAIAGLVQEDGFVKRGEKEIRISSFKHAFEVLLQESKKGLSFQRYKGLGEMNAEQLWETTMDPGSRRMLQVTIQDAVAADQLFTTLMGDQVEPRREFIEANALQVENLDV
jgi:DNA gyrase subunit B